MRQASWTSLIFGWFLANFEKNQEISWENTLFLQEISWNLISCQEICHSNWNTSASFFYCVIWNTHFLQTWRHSFRLSIFNANARPLLFSIQLENVVLRIRFVSLIDLGMCLFRTRNVTLYVLCNVLPTHEEECWLW